MHRTNHVLRLIGWSLLIGLLQIGTQAASGQVIQPIQLKQGGDRNDIASVMMTTGNTQSVRHSSKKNLKRVENPNIKVLNVTRVVGNPTAVLFEAVAPGRSRVTLVDQDDKVDLIDVIVVSDRVKELRDMILRAVPNANIIINSTDNGNSVVLSGFAMSTEDTKTIQAIAGQLFGPNVVNNIHIGGVQQVQLEVIIAVVNRTRLRQMSFSWVNNRSDWFLSSIIAPANVATAITTAVGGATSSVTGAGANIPFGLMNNTGSFQGFLQALNTEGLAKILAEPRLVTLSGRPANILSGGTFQAVAPSGGVSSSSVSTTFGTSVKFLPIVLGNGKIHLEISPQLSALAPTPTFVTLAPGTISYATTQRSASVAVQIEDGQTLAIGGLIQNTVTAQIQRVPILGDLPFIGMAFTSKSYDDEEEEFIILVTPRLVDPVDCTKIPKLLPGRETRNPDDFELFMEGIMEAPRGQRNLGLVHYPGAHTASPNSGLFPCNDASGCYGRRDGNGSGNCDSGACANPGYPLMNNNPGNPIPIPAPQSRPVQSLPPAGNVRFQTDPDLPTLVPPIRETGYTPMPVPPVRDYNPMPTTAPMPVPAIPAPALPVPAPSNRESAPPSLPSFPAATAPATPLPALPPLPVSLGRELDNRPVLPPVSFGPASTDLNNAR